MAQGKNTTHPVETLRELTTTLEASVLECLAKSKKEAVHKVRTSTRRIEAQLELLGMLKGVPAHADEREKARRLLKKLRKAAGRVRDLDVQRDLIAAEVAGEKGGDKASPAVQKTAKRLRRKLKRTRKDEVERLERLLKAQRKRVPQALAKMLDAMAPTEEVALSEARLIGQVRRWYKTRSRAHASAAASGDADHLHAMRKLAKLARYVAESAPQSATAVRRLASRFETLQEAGGEWHDWTVLAEIAAHELGDDAELPRRFQEHAESALDSFQRRLRYRM